MIATTFLALALASSAAAVSRSQVRQVAQDCDLYNYGSVYYWPYANLPTNPGVQQPYDQWHLNDNIGAWTPYSDPASCLSVNQPIAYRPENDNSGAILLSVRCGARLVQQHMLTGMPASS
jgi:hypothetical protein